MATNNSSDYKPTQYNVQVGGALGTLSDVAPSAASGIPLISAGSSANPSFGTALVPGGGTGAVSFTAHGVILGEGTSALGVTAAGTTGQVLTGVTGSDPVWASPAASSISITGNSGGALTGNAFTFTGGTTGLTFSGAGSTETLGGTLVVSNGGSGAATFTAHGVLLGEGTTAFGVTAVGATGQVLTGVTASDPVWASPAASSIAITGDSGGALTGAAFTFTGGTTGLTFAGAGSTETLGGTLAIANGGTNATSMATTDGVVYYDGTRLVTTAVGTATNVLTSNGAGVAPTFQTAPGGGVLTVSVPLTNAQIKALRATPITAIAAQGAGTTIQIICVSGKLHYGGSNAFTDGAGSGIQLFYLNNAGILGATALSNAALISTANKISIPVLPASNNSADTAIENQPVVVTGTGATEIAGNAANNNTVTINVTYKVITL